MSTHLTDVLSQAYDAVPYASHPFPQSAPENLEAIAHLFGLAACPPAQARVLELGCASGGNLIPLAARYPQLQAVGIDLSTVQVQQGQQDITRAGLGKLLKSPSLQQVERLELSSGLTRETAKLLVDGACPNLKFLWWYGPELGEGAEDVIRGDARLARCLPH